MMIRACYLSHLRIKSSKISSLNSQLLQNRTYFDARIRVLCWFLCEIHIWIFAIIVDYLSIFCEPYLSFSLRIIILTWVIFMCVVRIISIWSIVYLHLYYFLRLNRIVHIRRGRRRSTQIENYLKNIFVFWSWYGASNVFCVCFFSLFILL